MLVGVEMAGTPGAGLHLIEYQGGMMAIAEGTQRLQERRVRRDHPAFADNRLDDHRAGARGDRRGDRLDIVIGQMGNALRQRSIIAGIFRLAANGDGEQRAAVEGVVEGDDFAFSPPNLSWAYFRASLRAASLASAPELQKNTLSARSTARGFSPAAAPARWYSHCRYATVSPVDPAGPEPAPGEHGPGRSLRCRPPYRYTLSPAGPRRGSPPL